MAANTLIDRLVFQVSLDKAKVINDMIELHLQPRRKWMPSPVWQWLIKRLLIIKEQSNQRR